MYRSQQRNTTTSAHFLQRPWHWPLTTRCVVGIIQDDRNKQVRGQAASRTITDKYHKNEVFPSVKCIRFRRYVYKWAIDHFGSWFDISRSILATICAKKRIFYIFDPSDLDIWPLTTNLLPTYCCPVLCFRKIRSFYGFHISRKSEARDIRQTDGHMNRVQRPSQTWRTTFKKDLETVKLTRRIVK